MVHQAAVRRLDSRQVLKVEGVVKAAPRRVLQHEVRDVVRQGDVEGAPLDEHDSCRRKKSRQQPEQVDVERYARDHVRGLLVRYRPVRFARRARRTPRRCPLVCDRIKHRLKCGVGEQIRPFRREGLEEFVPLLRRKARPPQA